MARRPDETARFLACLEPLAATTPLALAVSGGPDSMALLTLAVEALAGHVIAATVDHRLRRESAGEAAMVAAHCATIGVPHTVLALETPIVGASIQAMARTARYAALAEWALDAGATCLATAHHADDAAETFLMRAARGSGLAGLAGIRPATVIAGIAVVRPLLEWRRAELRAIVRRAAVPFVDDPANRDLRHDRTRFRLVLEENEWLDPPGIARAAGHLAQADADFRATADWLWGSHAVVTAARVVLDIAGMPRELCRRLARRAIATIDPKAVSDATNIEPLLDALEAGRSATQAGVLASAKDGVWRFRPAPPRRAN